MHFRIIQHSESFVTLFLHYLNKLLDAILLPFMQGVEHHPSTHHHH
jgi:hypothetical protein